MNHFPSLGTVVSNTLRGDTRTLIYSNGDILTFKVVNGQPSPAPISLIPHDDPTCRIEYRTTPYVFDYLLPYCS